MKQVKNIEKNARLSVRGLKIAGCALLQVLLIAGLFFLPVTAQADTLPAPPPGATVYNVGAGQTYLTLENLYPIISGNMQPDDWIILHDASSDMNISGLSDPWQIILNNPGTINIIGNSALEGGSHVYMGKPAFSGNPEFGGLFRVGLPGDPNATHVLLHNLLIGDNVGGYRVQGVIDASNSGQGGLFYGNRGMPGVSGLDLHGASKVIFSGGQAFGGNALNNLQHNNTGQGGALYGNSLFAVGVDLSGSQDVTFRNNQAGNHSVNDGQLTNSAQGGAIYGKTTASRAVDLNNSANLVFSGNSATAGTSNFTGQMVNSGQGGAIYARVGLNGIGVNLQGAQNVLFENNVAMSLADNSSATALGGAIFSNGHINLEGVTFKNNAAFTIGTGGDISSGRGGAIFVQADGGGMASPNKVNITPTSGKDVVFEGNYHNPGNSGKEFNSIYFGNTTMSATANEVNSVALNVNVADGAMLDMRDPMASQPDNMATGIAATPYFRNVDLAVTKEGPGTWHLGGNNDMASATNWQVNQGALHLVRGSNNAAASISLSHAGGSFSVAGGASLLVTPDESAHRITAQTITLAQGSKAGLASFSHGPENLAAGQRDMLVLAASQNLENQAAITQTSGTITIGSQYYDYSNLAWSVDRATLSGNLTPAGSNPATSGGYVVSTPTINAVYDPGRVTVVNSITAEFDRRAAILVALGQQQAQASGQESPTRAPGGITPNLRDQAFITDSSGRVYHTTTDPDSGQIIFIRPDTGSGEERIQPGHNGYSALRALYDAYFEDGLGFTAFNEGNVLTDSDWGAVADTGTTNTDASTDTTSTDTATDATSADGKPDDTFSQLDIINYNLAASKYSTMVSLTSGLVKELKDENKEVARNNGSNITTGKDGTVTNVYPDGSSVIIDPNGTGDSGGTVTTTLSDGTKLVSTILKDNTVNATGITYPDGSGSVDTYNNGVNTNTSFSNPDGTNIGSIEWDGNISAIQGKIDTLNNDSQMDNIKLQNLLEKRSNAFEMGTKVMDTNNESIQSILRHLFLTPQYRSTLFSRAAPQSANNYADASKTTTTRSWRDQATYLQPPQLLMLAAGENSSLFDTQPLWLGNPAGDGGTMQYNPATSIWLSPSYGYTRGWSGSGYKVNTPSLAAGLSHWFTDNFFLGFNISASWPETRSEFSENDARSIGFYLTGGYVLPNEIELGFMAGFGHTRNDQTRHVYGESYNAEYDSQSLSLGLNVGKRFNATQNLSFRPFVDYQFLSSYTDDYTEPNGTYALGYDSHRDNMHLLRLGSSITWSDDGGAIITGKVFYNGLFGDDTPESTSFFVQNPSGTFTSIGDRMEEHSLGLGLSFDLPLSGNFSLSLGIESLINERSINHTGNMGFMYKF